MWFEDDFEFYLSEQRIIKRLQPDLHYKKFENRLSLIGSFHLDATFNDKNIKDDYKIRIDFPKDYPESLPKVKEPGGKISWPVGDPNNHMYSDGTLCLETNLESKRIFEKEKNIGCFIRNLLVPYLYRESYIRIYGVEPFSGREHGGEGLINYYKERFNTSDIHCVLNLLSYALLKGYRGHHPCPCGSNLRLRKCHGPTIREINEMPKKKFLSDINNISNYLKSKQRAKESED